MRSLVYSCSRGKKTAVTVGAFGFLVYVYIFAMYDDKAFGDISKNKASVSTKVTISERDVSTRDASFRTLELFDVTEKDKFSRFIRFNVTDDGNQCIGRRFLIYTCKSGCNGWGDRLKGITTLFLLAQVTNRTFLIDMPTPCELHTLVKPNLYDWHKCLAEAKTISPNEAHHSNLMNGLGITEIDKIIYGTLERKKVISVQTNVYGVPSIRKHHLSTMIPWMRNLTDAEVVGSIIGTLFKPSLELSYTLAKFKTETVRERRLICGHIRAGRMRSEQSGVSLVLNFLKSYDKLDDVAIFVATDSMTIRNQARKLFSNFVSTERAIVHVAKVRGARESCEGFFAVLLDQLILSRCDLLVLTRSNFGAIAAYMRGEHQNLFLQHKTHIVNVTVPGIQDIYVFV